MPSNSDGRRHGDSGDSDRSGSDNGRSSVATAPVARAVLGAPGEGGDNGSGGTDGDTGGSDGAGTRPWRHRPSIWMRATALSVWTSAPVTRRSASPRPPRRRRRSRSPAGCFRRRSRLEHRRQRPGEATTGMNVLGIHGDERVSCGLRRRRRLVEEMGNLETIDNIANSANGLVGNLLGGGSNGRAA